MIAGKKQFTAWMLMLPSLVLFGFFVWEPVLSGIALSFYETKGFSTVAFNGLDNYADVIRDPAFVSAIRNSFSYTLWSIALGYALPIAAAIAINEVARGKWLFKFAVYFPNMVPAIAVLIMWQFMFEPGPGGLFNMIGGWLGFAPFGWLQNAAWTIPLITVTLVWRGFGPTTIIFLASLQSINKELYEAASIDGANIAKRLRHVTLPSIGGVMRIMLALQIIGVFQIFYEPLVMTDGGPNNASVSLILQSYYYAFRDFQAGKASAVGVIAFVMIAVVSAIYMRLTRGRKEEA